jgi:hypothetical protein
MAQPVKKIVRKKVVAKTQDQKYTELQNLMVEFFGLEVGDSVQVISEVEENESGSCSNQSNNIGEILVIEDISIDGIFLSDENWYPVYALKKDLNSFKINDDYNAQIDDDGSVIIGCTTVGFDLLTKIYTAALAKNEEYVDNY